VNITIDTPQMKNNQGVILVELKTHEVKDGVELKISEPFQPFDGDCDSCEHFYTIPLWYPGGKCLKHGFGCGYGFTCEYYKKTNQ